MDFQTFYEEFENRGMVEFARRYKAAKDKKRFLNIFFVSKRNWDSWTSESPVLPLQYSGIYGMGTYSIVFRVIDGKGDEYAFKMTTRDEETESDLKVHVHLAQVGLAPTIYLSCYTKGILCLVMDPIKTSLREMSGHIDTSAFIRFLERKARAGFVHGDMHASNIVLLKSGEFGLIDFDYSFFSPPFHTLDFIPLIGSLRHLSRLTGLREFVKDYCLTRHCMDIEDSEFGDPTQGYSYRGLTSYARFHGFKALNKAFPNIKL